MAKKKGKKVAKKKAARAASTKRKVARVSAVPKGLRTATPHLIVSPCKDAIAFYAKAFGARPRSSMDGPAGIVLHAEIEIGDSVVMLSDENPQSGHARRTPRSIGATTGGVMLYVKDVDALHARAVAAGAKSVMPPMDMFWGDRYGQLEDPFGHVWAIATHVRDVTDREMRAAMEGMRGGAGNG
jgi:uncharacterized glyoxalase superfamily protein PhnB